MKIWVFVLAFLVLIGGTAVAQAAEQGEIDVCLELVSFGHERVKSVEDESLRAEIQKMLSQAESQCRAGDTAGGEATAKAAIDKAK